VLVRVCVLIFLALWVLPRVADAQTADDAALADRAMVYFDGDPLFEVRGVSALPATRRRDLIHGRLLAAAEDPGFDPATIAVTPLADGSQVGAPGHAFVNIYPSDARIEEVQPQVLATVVRDRLEQAISDYRADRTPEGLRHAVWKAILWSAAFAAVLVALGLGSRACLAFIDRHLAARIVVWEEKARSIVRLKAVWDTVRAALSIGFVVIGVLATYVWLDGVLLALPWTREAGRAALALVANPVRHIASGIAAAIPDLIALAVVAALTIAALRIAGRFFTMVGAGTLPLRNFDPEWAVPTGSRGC
jgi:hypothetical protein